ncbi:MAG: hypothetical protein K8T25_16085 [Planctomycetia bacterium]|nr:hypothetical protein [Planctomycetia bacterium]
MATSHCRPTLGRSLFCGLMLLLGATAVGCQVSVGGQTLPSGYYLQGNGDDVQYFAPGPQFPLQNEAAAQKARSVEAQQQRGVR